jgi:hypothetical protein
MFGKFIEEKEMTILILGILAVGALFIGATDIVLPIAAGLLGYIRGSNVV